MNRVELYDIAMSVAEATFNQRGWTLPNWIAKRTMAKQMDNGAGGRMYLGVAWSKPANNIKRTATKAAARRQKQRLRDLL